MPLRIVVSDILTVRLNTAEKCKNANRHARDSADMKAWFAQMRKENKKFMKKLSSKKKSKKSKWKQYCSSSDSSDDSDSE